MSNTNMHKAKKEKNDEFYTMYKDVEREVDNYKEQLKGKVIYCNCDSEESNFVKYFKDNYDKLGLKGLLYSHLKPDGSGSFDSEDNIELLRKSDIVITNPPFSLFRDFISLLEEHNKKFLVIGNLNAVTYKEIFKLIKEDKLNINKVNNLEFYTPLYNENNNVFIKGDKKISKFNNICWFTNLQVKNEKPFLPLTKKYSPEEYSNYDNYDAINVDRLKDIPEDYKGVMGVPITFLAKHNPEQFEILGQMNTGEINVGIRHINTKQGKPVVKGKIMYARILIKHRNFVKVDASNSI